MTDSLSASVPASDWKDGAPAAAGLGRLGVVQQDGTGLATTRWVLKRNCALTPSQLLKVYGGLSAVSLAIATAFAIQGAVVVLLFSALEMFVLGVALLVFCRHVRDGETVTLSGPLLKVEQSCGPHTQHYEFRAEWVSVEPYRDSRSLIEIRGQGRCVRVGRFVRPHLRLALAQEIRQALRERLRLLSICA